MDADVIDKASIMTLTKVSFASQARAICIETLEGGSQQALATAAALVDASARQQMELALADPILREWHELLLDFGAALLDKDPAWANTLEATAEELYAAIVFADRNPEEKLLDRVPARRLVETIAELGDRCAQGLVREKLGYKGPHFSNILGLLKSYQFVSSEQSDGDGRGRLLSLTPRGRIALATARERGLLRPEKVGATPKAMPRIEKTTQAQDDFHPPFPVIPAVQAVGYFIRYSGAFSRRAQAHGSRRLAGVE